MLDIAVAYNRYKFIGYEFLTWLWFYIENDGHAAFRNIDRKANLNIGNRLVLENRAHDRKESITITGDDAGLEEAMLALQKGALVAELNLLCTKDNHEYRFTLKGESFHIGQLKTPETESVQTSEDMEGAILEKIYLYETALTIVDHLFGVFIINRLDSAWERDTVPIMKNWIYNHHSATE